jgi:alginate O-acetyltransferase complex protein AlgI
MFFNSIEYLLFLPTVLGSYWLIRDRRAQNALLLVASYVFYGWFDARFLALMWLSTLTDYTVGRLLERTEDDRRRKRIFLVSVAVNLGILGTFKYFNFFVDSAAQALRTLGFDPHLPVLRLVLPPGISFYTFHGISYTFDVYRRDVEPSRSLLDFACFIAYFPQLVAGPIGRAHIQLPQFANPRTPPRWQEVRSGLFLILLGLFKKVVIADGLAPMVDRTFADAGTAGFTQLIVGAYGFMLQIYGDFSGYSDIARGSSRLFGIELIRNFEQPFLSTSVSEFWRTWHISLSTWLRDYLFVPLGGSRRGPLITYRNIMITMLLAGLWHGANWTFVTFGGLIGLYMVIERALAHEARAKERSIAGPVGAVPVGTGVIVRSASGAAADPRPSVDAPWPRRFEPRRDLLPAFGTFTLIVLTAVFFRAHSFGQAARFLAGIFTLRPGPFDPDALALLVLLGGISFAIDLVQRNARDETVFLSWAPTARGALYAALVVGILLFSGSTPVPFIYFQF